MDKVERYKKESIGCECINWARADYISGYMTLHHANCKSFIAHNELHVMNRELMSSISNYQKSLGEISLLKDNVKLYKGALLKSIEYRKLLSEGGECSK